LFGDTFVGCVGLFPNGQGKGETLHGRDLACVVLWASSSSIALDFVKRVSRDPVTHRFVCVDLKAT